MASLLADIRPDERRATLGAFGTLFGLLAGHTLLETARDALFLSRLPASHLPWTYLGIAVFALIAFGLDQLRTGSRVRRRDLSVWLTISAIVTLGFWWLVREPGQWGLYALYIWSGVFATLLVVRFWTLIGEYFSIAQAKRLFALIGTGSVLGAITGSALARLMTQSMEPRDVLLASAIAMFATGFVPLFVLPRVEAAEDPPVPLGPASSSDMRRHLQVAFSNTYLKRIGAIVLLSTISFTLVDFIFKSLVAETVAAEDLGSFFAGAYLLFNLLSLVVQLALVRYMVRFVRILKIHHFLSVMPALILAGAMGVVLGGGLFAAYLIKGVDGALRHSLHRTSTEMLFVHLTGNLRGQVKGLIDVAGQRGGQAIASLLILGLGAFGVPVPVLAVVAALAAAGWLYASSTITPYYLNLFRRTLGEDAIESRIEYPELDVASFASLMRALNSQDDGEVLAAIDLLAAQERVDVIPGLILYHPSTKVVTRTLELFSTKGRDDILPILDRLIEHEDPDVRAATLRARSWMAPDADLFARSTGDRSAIVRATALVGQVSFSASPEAARTIEAIAETGSTEARLAVARAIRYSPGAAFEEVLILLHHADEQEVRIAVAEAMAEIRSVKFVPSLIEMLASRELRSAARSTLVAIGPDALHRLRDALATPWLDHRIRRHVPRTISRFRSQSRDDTSGQNAVDILIGNLVDESDSVVRYKILRALGRLREDEPSLRFDPEVLRSAAEGELSRSFTELHWEVTVVEEARHDPKRKTVVHGLIVELLRNRRERSLERLFRILGLSYPDESMRTIYRGLTHVRRASRASSRELLEHILEAPIREPLLAIVDEIGEGEKLRQAGPFLKRRPLSYVGTLREMLENGGVGMRSLVVYHIGELGLHELSEPLRSLPSDPGGLVSQAVERALLQLEPAGGNPS